MLSSEEVRSLLDTAIVLLAGQTTSRRSEHFHALLTRGADPDVLFIDRWKWEQEHSSTLLDTISTLTDFDSLVASGFKSFNDENSSGAHPLMKLAESNDPRLLRKYIESGSLVNHRDRSGRTALHVITEDIWEAFLRNSDSCSSRFEKFQCAEELLNHGSNGFLGDKCRCACSRIGCTPGHIILKEYREFWRQGYFGLPRSQYFLSLVWLDLIRKVDGLENAKQCLLDIIRLVRFEELELTYTCCRKLSSEWKGLWTTLDEENQIIADLEFEMCEIEKNIHSGSDLDTIFFSEVTNLIQIRNGRQRSLFLARQADDDSNVSTSQERMQVILHADLPSSIHLPFLKSAQVFKTPSNNLRQGRLIGDRTCSIGMHRVS